MCIKGFRKYDERTRFLLKKARMTYLNIKSRCENTSNNRYKWYGAKNIKLEIAHKEFVSWYLLQNNNKDFIRPSVGRIDHSKNYSLDNIELVETSQNSKERIKRLGTPTSKKGIFLVKDVFVFEFDSIGAASKYLGADERNVADAAKRRGSCRGHAVIYV